MLKKPTNNNNVVKKTYQGKKKHQGFHQSIVAIQSKGKAEEEEPSHHSNRSSDVPIVSHPAKQTTPINSASSNRLTL
ncbi:hypothetical protein PGT21_028560 [Puccinia graminis f. sp. tritici]|uniref:Uncharacterized protein n=1 Tax=Puccinia graminis f. sp. tritici TaxID=56615 RepID=A0A5B0RPV9_PUCGR|nr:hypothetical protein PGT21_028560 [Puccinia graminis f. sp. tritici]KAA1127961.1 hypothetical protein PGTUg99_008532 [Puccinia graminis f. sp. tritici]